MPQLVVLIMGALSLYFAYRWFRAELRRVDAGLKRARTSLQKQASQMSITPLAFDATTGVYHPIETA